MPKVPKINFPKQPERKNVAIYCFRPGTSGADKQHDIAQVNKFIEHIKAKRKRGK